MAHRPGLAPAPLFGRKVSESVRARVLVMCTARTPWRAVPALMFPKQ